MKLLFKKLLPFLIAPVLLLSFTSMPAKINLSGEWKLNESKSDFGEFGSRFASKSITVEQKDDAITISKTGANDNVSTETLTFDGKESESTVFGTAKKKSTAKWTDDGQSLIIKYSIAMERNGQTMEFTGTETWSLKDGSLSLQTVSSSPRGEMTTKAIYDK